MIQADDTTNSGTGWLNCGSSASFCSQQGASNSQWNGWTEAQTVTVTNITGNVVTFTPGLHAPNWSSAKNPKAWWPNSLPLTGVGIEDISFDCHSQSLQCVVFLGDTNSWYIGNRTYSTGSNHVGLETFTHITVQSNYMYGGSGSSEGYGVNSENGSADNLIINNICNHNANCMVAEGGDSGSVIAYNYAIDDYFGPGSYQQGPMTHSAGNHMELWEGNDTPDIQNDLIHGPSNAGTYYRNYITGRDTATTTGVKTTGTVALNIGASNRYYNAVGNVLGTSGYHTNYTDATTSATSCGTGTENNSIYLLGYSDQWGGAYSNACLGSSFNIANDMNVATTFMRWGNWDVVHASNVNSTNDTSGIQWVAGENASGANTYPGLASPSQTLPASFFLSSTPAWWVFPNGTTAPFPGTGPDVTNGDVASTGGHANYNPAANCYLNVMGGKTDGSSGQLIFNPNICYLSGASTPTPTPTMSGTLTPSSPTCTIVAGGSGCNVTLTWSTTNPVGTSSITATGMTTVTGNSGSQSFGVPYSSQTFYLYNNATLLAKVLQQLVAPLAPVGMEQLVQLLQSLIPLHLLPQLD